MVKIPQKIVKAGIKWMVVLMDVFIPTLHQLRALWSMRHSTGVQSCGTLG